MASITLLLVLACSDGEALGYRVWVESHFGRSIIAVGISDPKQGIGDAAYVIPADGALHKIPWVDVLGARDKPPREGALRLFTLDCRLLDEVTLPPGHFHIVIDGAGQMSVDQYQGYGPTDTQELAATDDSCASR